MRNLRCSCVSTSNCAQLAPATKVLISSNCLSCVPSGRLLPPAGARHRRPGAGASWRRAAQVRGQGGWGLVTSGCAHESASIRCNAIRFLFLSLPPRSVCQTRSPFVYVDAHILATPAIADLDGDGAEELVVAVSYFYDRQYYEKEVGVGAPHLAGPELPALGSLQAAARLRSSAEPSALGSLRGACCMCREGLSISGFRRARHSLPCDLKACMHVRFCLPASHRRTAWSWAATRTSAERSLGHLLTKCGTHALAGEPHGAGHRPGHREVRGVRGGGL